MSGSLTNMGGELNEEIYHEEHKKSLQSSDKLALFD